ncbi:MAG: hypothetical protein WBA74_14250, partial [Cyclobacteriaceae bacterium]
VSLLKFVGGKKEKSGNYTEAAAYYRQAYDLAKDAADKADLNMLLARLYQRTGDYGTSYKYALRNTGYPDEKQAAWELIGDLWYASFQKCKEGKSIVQDRAVYLSAWKAYKKSGNQKKMTLAAQQFPSINEIFNELMKEGEELEVNCWATDRVVIQQRKDVTQ